MNGSPSRYGWYSENSENWGAPGRCCCGARLRGEIAGDAVESGTPSHRMAKPAYHTVLQILQHPIYAGAYVFGRTGQRTRVVDGRARKTEGHRKSMDAWNVLLRKDHHPGYIPWEEFEENQKMISENAHMQKRMVRKSARGGRALLTGLVRCGRCGRMMRIFYGARSGHSHRYQCRGDDLTLVRVYASESAGVRVDRAVASTAPGGCFRLCGGSRHPRRRAGRTGRTTTCYWLSGVSSRKFVMRPL